MWFYAPEGGEVPPSGYLLEYSTGMQTPRGATLHVSARRPLQRRREYPRFFLSYRREDSEPYAWRMHETMSTAWGEIDVFLDQFSIQPGEVWSWTIQQAVVHAKAVVMLVGPRWLTIADGHGHRRLDQEDDAVRRETVAALDRGTLVVPLLLPGTNFPERTALPFELQTLTDLQFFQLSARHWRTDVGHLKTYLEQYFKDVLKDHIS